MAFTIAEALVKVSVDRTSLEAGFKSIQTGVTGSIKRLDSLARHAAVTFGALTVKMGLLSKTASEAEENESKFEAVFKNQAQAAREWSDEFAKAANRSGFELRAFMGTLQDTLVPMGFARSRARELTQQVVKLGVDLASFNNEAEPDVINALTSAIVGNHGAVRRFGIILGEATLAQELLNMGFKGTWADADTATKAQARLNIIMASSADAMGDAERTSGSFANTIKGLKANSQELAIQLGNELLPSLRNMAAGLGNVVTKVKDTDAGVKQGWVTMGLFGTSLSGIVLAAPKVVGALVAIKGAVVGLATISSVLAGGIPILIGALAAAGAAFLTAKAKGQSFGETVLELTQALPGLERALGAVDQRAADWMYASRDSKTDAKKTAEFQDMMRTVDSARGTEESPEVINDTIAQLEKKKAEIRRDWDKMNENQKRDENNRIDLYNATIKRLQQRLVEEKKVSAELKEQRELEEAAAAAEERGRARFEKKTGMTPDLLEGMTGLRFSGQELAAGADKASRDARDKKASQERAKEEAKARAEHERKEEQRRSQMKSFRRQGVNAREGRELMGDLFSGGLFSALSKIEELREKKQSKDTPEGDRDSRSQIMGVEDISKQIQLAIRKDKPEEEVKKLHQTVKTDGVKIANVDDFAPLFGLG